MIDDKRKFPLGALYLLARGYFRFRQRTGCWWLVDFLFCVVFGGPYVPHFVGIVELVDFCFLFGFWGSAWL